MKETVQKVKNKKQFFFSEFEPHVINYFQTTLDPRNVKGKTYLSNEENIIIDPLLCDAFFSSSNDKFFTDFA